MPSIHGPRGDGQANPDITIPTIRMGVGVATRTMGGTSRYQHLLFPSAAPCSVGRAASVPGRAGFSLIVKFSDGSEDLSRIRPRRPRLRVQGCQQMIATPLPLAPSTAPAKFEAISAISIAAAAVLRATQIFMSQQSAIGAIDLATLVMEAGAAAGREAAASNPWLAQLIAREIRQYLADSTATAASRTAKAVYSARV